MNQKFEVDCNDCGWTLREEFEHNVEKEMKIWNSAIDHATQHKHKVNVCVVGEEVIDYKDYEGEFVEDFEGLEEDDDA